MSRLFTTSQVVRTISGLVLSLIGLAILLADSYVAYVTRASAHGLNLGLGALFLWAGGYVLDPKYVTTMVGTLVRQLRPAINAYASGGGGFGSGTFLSSSSSAVTPTATPAVPPPPAGKSKPPTFPPPTIPGA